MTFLILLKGVFAMKGILFTGFGLPEDVLKLGDVEKPVPLDNQVIVKVKASSLNITDYVPFKNLIAGEEVPPHIQHMYTVGLKAVNRVFGMDIAGVVDEIGKDVTTVKPGDKVYGFTADWLGAWGEYACANENEVALKPSNITFEEAAVLPVVGLVALGGVRLADIQHGQEVLVHGASGGVGLLAVQFLKAFGANVTAVCSTRNVSQVKKAGADAVLDYTKEDVLSLGKTFDCIFAINGYRAIEDYIKLLKPDGIMVFIGGNDRQIAEIQQFGQEKFAESGKRLEKVVFNTLERELAFIAKLVEDGKVTPLVDHIYPVSDVPTAIRNVLKNHAQGKTAISVNF